MSFRSPRPRRVLLIASSLLLALVASNTLLAQKKHRPKHVKEQIEALEEQWRTATVASDVPALDKLLSDDYVGISWTGMVATKQMQLDRIRTHAISIQQMELSDIKVKVVGPVAIVTSLASVVGSTDGHRMDGAFRYTRVYQRLPTGIWKLTNFEGTRIPSADHAHRNDRENVPPPPHPEQ